MTNDISVVTKSTRKKRIKQGIIAGLLAVLLGGGIGGVNHLLKNRDKAKKQHRYEMNIKTIDVMIEGKYYPFAEGLLNKFEEEKVLDTEDIQKLRIKIKKEAYNNRIERVNDAIKEENYSLADVLLNQFGEEKSLESVDLKILKMKKERNKNVSELKKFIKEYDYENANKLVSKLETTDMYSLAQIDEFKRDVEGITSKGLAKKIREAKEKELVKLCRDYLSIYPKEKESDEVVERLLIHGFKDLAQKLDDTEFLKDVLNSIQNLNEDLERYKQAKTSISRIVVEAELKQKIEQYVQQKKDIGYEGSKIIMAGVKVKVIDNFKRWGDYGKDRVANFPIGTKGKVLKPWNDGDVLVEFDRNGKYSWSDDDYSFSGEWKKRGHNGIARFEPGELEALTNPVSPIELNKFQLEFERLLKNYTKHLE